MSYRLLGALVAICVMAAASGCNEDDIERSLGDMSAAAIEATFPVVEDPALSAWVSNMGHTLVSYSTRQQVPYRFKVIDTDMVNAFAAPWGHIYVTTGLLEFAQDEEEVWGVMAHEIGHVVHRHSIKSAKESFLFSIGVALLSRKSETLGQVAGLGLGLLSRRHSRDEEYQADDHATMLSYMAGHDPRGSVDFFHRLFTDLERGRRPSSIEVMFQTHPPTQDRIARQMAKPALAGSDPSALLRVARGAMRRGRYAYALGYLEKASSIAPRSAEVAAVWGDALMARGDGPAATPLLEKALSRTGNDRYLRARLEIARSLTPGVPAPPAPSELVAASTALQRVSGMPGEAAAVADRAHVSSEKILTAVEPLAQSATRTNDTLMSLGASGGNLSDDARGALVAINSAVSRAADPVYSLEWLQREFRRLGPELADLTASGLASLSAASRGEAAAGEAAIAQRSLLQTRHALSELDSSRAAAEGSIGVTVTAQNAAQESLVAAQRIMRNKQDDQNLNAIARLAAHQAQSSADAASAASAKARNAARMAGLRAMVARLNLMALGLPPARQEALNTLIAHFTVADAQRVAELREAGLGVGEAAFLLASRSGDEPATESGATGSELAATVDALISGGRGALGPRVLLRFLLQAMSAEVATS